MMLVVLDSDALDLKLQSLFSVNKYFVTLWLKYRLFDATNKRA